ncbi:MAG TPA: polysaccharide deacetylase family protein [Stellaceae bacterium]|jgi:peptidoglycan/xylan/chitin deacetylase (PgdA/CDA1 family)
MVKEGLLRAARAGGGFALTRRAARKSLRILAYHGLWTTPGYQYGNHLFMTPEQFKRRMVWLKRSRHPVLSLDDAVRRLGRGDLPDNAVVITIDDGWSSTYTHMLPILEELSLPATVYITTWYSENQLPVVNVVADYILKRAGEAPEKLPGVIAEIEKLPSIPQREEALRECASRFGVTIEEWWEGRQFHVMSTAEIRDADLRGLDIQLHTHRHRSSATGSDDLAREIADNRAALARACARPEHSFSHFCYPSGVNHASAAAVLEHIRVKSATLVEPGINPRGTNPYRLRRFLDGRSISDTEFEAYLSGVLEVYGAVKSAAESLPGLRALS